MIVSTEGLRMDPTKVQAIMEWQRPNNLKEVQSFVGFYNFYRRFIKGFSKIIKALIRLTKKDMIFEWTNSYQEAFQTIKDTVTSTPILTHFNRIKEAILETNSSDYINGGVLSQYNDDGVLHPVAFYSKNITPAECNYHIYDKELLAIIRCLEHWRADLEGTDDTIKIYTDHQGLMYFAESQELTRRQARYLDILSEFNIRVIFRPGPRNAKADALTRLPGSRPVNTKDERVQHQRQTILTPDRLELDGVTVLAVEDPIFHRIAEANRTDEDIADMRQAITEGKQSLGFLKL